jgi:hypothetical protein
MTPAIHTGQTCLSSPTCAPSCPSNSLLQIPSPHRESSSGSVFCHVTEGQYVSRLLFQLCERHGHEEVGSPCAHVWPSDSSHRPTPCGKASSTIHPLLCYLCPKLSPELRPGSLCSHPPSSTSVLETTALATSIFNLRSGDLHPQPQSRAPSWQPPLSPSILNLHPDLHHVPTQHANPMCRPNEQANIRANGQPNM